MQNFHYNKVMDSKRKTEFNFTLKDDYAFKRLLGVEENKEILQDFLRLRTRVGT